MTRCSNYGGAVTHLDFYGKTLGFHYNGADKMRSCTGATLSLIIFVAVVVSSLIRLGMLEDERFSYFTRHQYEHYFEGMTTTS